MPLVYSYKASRDCYVVSGQNYTEPSVNGIPTVYNDGINGTKNVKEIADFGFNNLNNLQFVIIPSGIDYIGHRAFENCQSLKNVFILDAPLTIGGRAFYDCTTLTGLFLGNSIQKVEKSGCGNLYALRQLNFPDSLTGIEDNAFSVMATPGSQLTGMNMPKNIKRIGNYAFAGNVLLNISPYFYIPETLESLGTGAFFSCNIKEVRFGSNKLDKIFPNTFARNYNMEYAYFHTGLKEIHAVAFFECRNLKNLYFPSGTIFIGTHHFVNCEKLLYANIPSGTGNLSIPEGCFEGCRSLQRVDFGENVDKIGANAFKYCWNLGYTGQTGTQETAIAPIYPGSASPGSNINSLRLLYWTGFGEIQNVKLITGNLGTGNNDLLVITGLYPKNFDLPTGLTSLFNGALVETRVNKILTIPKNLTAFSINDVRTPINLESYEVHPDNPNLASHSGLLYNKAKDVLLSCPFAKTGEINLLNTTKILGGNSLSYTSGVSYVELNNNLQKISAAAFYRSALTGIRLSTGLNEIADYVFFNTPLRTIDFSNCNSLSYLGPHGFADCYNLTGLILPTGNNFTALFPGMFRNCSQLLSLNVPNNIKFLGNGFDTNPATAGPFGVLGNNLSLQTVYLGTGINYNQGDTFISVGSNSYTFTRVNRNLWFGDQSKDGVFSGVFVAENHPSLRSISGVLYTKNSGELVTYPYHLSRLQGFNTPPFQTFYLPDYVTGISEKAFDNSFIRSYFLGYNCKIIRTRAFNNSSITGITISNGEVEESFVIPGTTVRRLDFGETGNITLRSYALYRFTALTGLYLPSGVNLFSSDVLFFDSTYFSELKEINVHPDNPFMSSLDGVLYNKSQTEMIHFPAQKQGSLTLPDNLTGIGRALVKSKINYLKFGKGITWVPSNTLYGNVNLTGIDFGEYVTGLAGRAIRTCISLEVIYFGSGMSHFEFIDNASNNVEPIYNCRKLREIIYPNKLFTTRSFSPVPVMSSGRNLLNIVKQSPPSNFTGIFNTAVRPGDPLEDDIIYGLTRTFDVWNGKPRTVIRYTPLNDQECIINHIDFQFSDKLPIPFPVFGYNLQYDSWLTGQIPETLYGRKVISLSGVNNLTGIFGENDNFTKSLYIRSGIEIKNPYLQSLKISGLKKLEKIIVDPNNPYYESEDGILYTKDKNNIMAAVVKYYDSGFCIKENITGIYGEAFAYNENINNITFKGNAPQIGQNIFTGANPNLKIYRKKYAKGFGEYLEDRKLYYRSDNIILTNGPSNKFNIFTGENGKMTTFYTC